MSWAFSTRFKILLLILLVVGGGAYLIHREMISEKIVGLPECLQGSIDTRCYEGKRVSFGNTRVVENNNNVPILIQEIENSLPFGYSKAAVTFDIYNKTGVFIESVSVVFDIAPLATTLVALESKNISEIPAMAIPSKITLGTPEFINVTGEQKLFTYQLFTVKDSKFTRSLTIPLTIFTKKIPQEQTYTVIATGTMRGSTAPIQKIYQTKVFFEDALKNTTTLVIPIDQNFNVNNVELSCKEFCLGL